jgi:hypothetical protein
MKKSIIAAVIIACAGLFSAPPAFAQRRHFKVIDVSASSEGDKIRGPLTIKPVRVNRIRYRVEIKGKTTFTAGPNIAIPGIIPPVPSGGSGGGASAADAAATARQLNNNLDTARKTRDPEAEFQVIRLAQTDLIARRADIQNQIAPLIADTNTALNATKAYVNESNDRLRDANGPTILISRLPDLIQKIQNSEGNWPDEAINRFLADVDIWEGELGRISDLQWLAQNKDRLDTVKARFKELRESVKALSRNGAADGPAARFDEAQRVLGQWKEIFTAAQAQKEAFFELEPYEAGCGFSFDQNKETVVKLVKQDRLAADSAVIEQELVTVVCSSPFSVSGGFGFSTLNEREFVFVQSTKPVTTNGQTTQQVINRFGFKNNSSFRPIPLLLINTRLHEWNDTVALHLSAGAGVDIKTGEAGSDVEFIVGPSISFKRSMFITAGFHVGRVPKLAGGFNLGDEVPEGIDNPPIEKAWKTGFITTVTFKLR